MKPEVQKDIKTLVAAAYQLISITRSPQITMTTMMTSVRLGSLIILYILRVLTYNSMRFRRRSVLRLVLMLLRFVAKVVLKLVPLT